MAKLVLMVGLPRSGKSTRARHLSKGYGAPIVSPDAIRLVLHGTAFRSAAEPMVWGTAKTMVRALFEVGHEIVILDACNHTHERRREWRGPWEQEFQILQTSKEMCLSRLTEDLGRDPSRMEEVIDRMEKAFEYPVTEDGTIVLVGGR